MASCSISRQLKIKDTSLTTASKTSNRGWTKSSSSASPRRHRESLNDRPNLPDARRDLRRYPYKRPGDRVQPPPVKDPPLKASQTLVEPKTRAVMEGGSRISRAKNRAASIISSDFSCFDRRKLRLRMPGSI